MNTRRSHRRLAALALRLVVMLVLALWVVVGSALAAPSPAAPLATLRYSVVGQRLQASPATVSVPRNISGSILVELSAAEGAAADALRVAVAEGAQVEATLRGPSFPAQRLLGRYGEALVLPPLRVVGDYQLDDIRLVRGSNTVLQATPASIPVHVFDEVLVSRVVSRPLSLEEIRDKGIALDEANFRVVEFDVTLVLRGKSFRVLMPVAAPQAKLSTEIIPAAELEDRTVELDRLNRELAKSVELPPEFATELPDFRMNAINFEEVQDGEEEEKKTIPISGLLVIPGNVAFLNQFFSVQLFTENAAPTDSRLTVNNLRATMRLPTGADTVPGRSYAEPGDDPLRMARVGPDKVIQTNLPVVLAGADGQVGTADDVTRLRPGETGTAEFLVEGLHEGLHLLDIDLEGDLEGLAAGSTRIRGRTSGSVLVRNANFSLTFAHPITVRAGEPYQASVTLLNTGDVEANLVSVGLNRLALSGVVLLSDEKVELGNLAPGESATATFRFRSQRTGSVYFSNLTTSDDSVRGRLSLFAGVDERGVALSPDSIGYPEWVSALPTELFAAADRVLGQALSVATAGRLPSGVRRTTTRVVEEKVIELAEAGQRLRYDDDPRRVFADLALDWQGSRTFDAGFDQILRETDAGREWREAVARQQETGDPRSAPERLGGLASSLAGLGRAWWMASVDVSDVELTEVSIGTPLRGTNTINTVTRGRSEVQQALGYGGSRGNWIAARPGTNVVFSWRVPQAMPKATLGFLEIGADGAGENLVWTLDALQAGEVLEFRPTESARLIRRRANSVTQLEPLCTPVSEDPPAVVSVRQDISVVSDRVFMRCPIREYGNWGTVIAVLFNKPMNPAHLSRASDFTFADGNGARTVQLQPGRRVLLLQLHRGIGSFAARPRDYALQIASLADPRGNRSTAGTYPVLMTPAKGGSLRGRVYGVDGQPVAGVPVTLTMIDRVGNKCLPAEFRAGQVFTDDAGFFTLDFVLADIPFNLAAIDTSRMSNDDARAVLGTLLEAVGPRGADRERLQQLVEEPNTRAAMLQAFHLGEIGEAIAAAEGLDRAVYQDLITQGSGRDGSELSVALRFRGRATVTGHVRGAGGALLAGAAVNLFPDPESRELGRGVFTTADGSFVFPGVPLGEVSLQAETLDGRRRRLADRLLVGGEIRDFELVMPDVVERLGGIRGRVIEAEGAPHPAARVYVAKQVAGSSASGVVATGVADADGAFEIAGVPAGTWAVAAIAADGRRRGVRDEVRVEADATTQIQVALEATATLRGIVRYWDGTPAPNAKVGGGDRVVRTDALGQFVLTGVPLGLRNIVAGVDAPDARDGVTRLGTTQIQVVPLGNDDVTVKLNPLGRIRGRVVNGAGGVPVPNVRVAIPTTGGFFWTTANALGEYEFNAMGLGGYVVSAPSPPVKKDGEQLAAEALDAVGSATRGGSLEEAAALVGQLANLYTQGSLGRLTTEEFVPGSWGYNTTKLEFDGQTVVANIEYRPGASLAGTVVNHQDVPIGAEVMVRGFGPNKVGAPTMKEFGPVQSRPDSGQWAAGGFLVGPYTVTASSPLLVGEATAEGLLTAQRPNLTNVVLKFPPQREVTGRLTGQVLNPDGSKVARAAVQINFAADYVIHTDTNGFFDTQIRLPERDYVITATNLDSGLVGQTWFRLQGGITNFAVVPLLGKGSLEVEVIDASGKAIDASQVRLKRTSFPREADLQLTTDARGRVVFADVWEGDWQVDAEKLIGANKATGAAGVVVSRDLTNTLRLALGAVGRIQGVFVERQGGAPIAGAQVIVRADTTLGPVYGTAPTGDAGAFAITGLPVGKYVLIARHPVTGRLGQAEVRLATADSTVQITLVEEALGDLIGSVLTADGTRGVAGVNVGYEGPDRLSPVRTVTTGPEGEFRFAAVPVGRFVLTAFEPLQKLRGSVRGVLTEANSPLRAEVRLDGLAMLEVVVVESDGVTPATNATVMARVDPTRSAETDETGRVLFTELPLGQWPISARSLRPGQGNSTGETKAALVLPGEVQRATLRLSGVATLAGVLRDGNGRPAATAAIEWTGGRQGESPRATVSAADGTFALADLPLGPWRLQATLGALAAFSSGEFLQAGDSTNLTLRLGASGTLLGSVIRESGAEVRDVDVACFFTAQDGSPGFARTRADGVGAFRMNGLPVATPLRVLVEVPALDGRFTLTTNLAHADQELDLGALRLDQSPPQVTAITPTNGTVGVESRPQIGVTFSEPVSPASLRSAGLWLLQGTNAAGVDFQLTNGPAGADTALTITPREALRSAREYTLVLFGGDQLDRNGRPVSLGPEDLQGRPLPRTVTSRFTVRDFEPPVVLNDSPTNHSAGVEPLAPVRFEFDEPIRTNALQLVVRSPGGVVAGTVGLNAGQRLLAWVPSRPFEPNTRYQVELSGVTDFSGNVAPPRTNVFDTLDTAGPRLVALRLASGQRAVANATVTVEAVLERAESGAVVRFARQGNDLGIAAESVAGVYRWPVRLPGNGSVRISATAVDLAGNPGEPVSLELSVVPNQRPSVTLTRLEPPTGPLETGRRFSFAVVARDDATVAAVQITARGALTWSQSLMNPPNGVVTNLLFELPKDFEAGADAEFGVVALDDSGAVSEEAVLRYATRDATPPELTLDAPLDGAVLDPRQPLNLALQLRDNSRRLPTLVQLEGAVSVSNRLDVVLTPNVPTTVPVTLSLTNGLEGGVVTLRVRAEDAGGQSLEVRRRYTLRGVVGPRVWLMAAVDRGSSWTLPESRPFSPWINSLNFYFDRAVEVHPGDSNRVVISNSVAMATRVNPRVSGSSVGVDFSGAALPPGSTLTVRVLPGLTDANGNAVLQPDGADLPPEGLTVRLHVAEFPRVEATAATRIVPGQTLPITVVHEPAFAPLMVELNGVPAATTRGVTNGSQFFVTLGTNATVARLVARSLVANRPALDVATVDLRVRNRTDDDDGDGLPNGWEADRSFVGGGLRFDPFRPADADADFDGDRLPNRDEFTRGTDPFDPDTDHDGLVDAAEQGRGGCPDAFVVDSDGDGIRDGDDLAPCLAGEALTLEPTSLRVAEGESLTNLVSVTGVGLTPLQLDFAPGVARPAFVQFADFAARGTNPLTRSLLLRPSFADAGAHDVTFAVFARRATSTMTSNLVLRLIVEDRANTRFTRWARPQDGRWSVATNWTAGVPGVGTNAVIDLPGDYTVTLDTSAFVEALNLGGDSGRPTLELAGNTLTVNGASHVATHGLLRLDRNARLTGQGRVVVEGGVEVPSGTLDGAGVLDIGVGGFLRIASSLGTGFASLARPIENRGLVEAGTNVFVQVGAALTNGPSGRWITDSSSWRATVVNASFENQGEWRKRSTNTTSISGLAVRQRGLLQVEAGELVVDSGTVDFAVGATNTGRGILRLSGVRGDVRSPLEFPVSLEFLNATLTNHATQTWPRAVLSGTSLTGTGEVRFTGVVGLNATTLAGEGWARITAGAIARLTNYVTLDRPFEIAGQLFAGTNLTVYVDSPSVVNRGTWEIAEGGLFRRFDTAGEGIFENAGTLIKRGAERCRALGVRMVNRGLLQVLGGDFSFEGGGSNQGEIRLAAASTASLGVGWDHGTTARLSGEGSVEFVGGTHDLPGEVQPAGGLRVSAGVVTLHRRVNSPVALAITGGQFGSEVDQDWRQVDLRNAELRGPGVHRVEQSLALNNGTLGAGAVLIVQTNAVGELGSGLFGGMLDNRGRLATSTDVLWRFAGGRWLNRGELEFRAGATLLGTSGTTNLFVNEGRWRGGTNATSFSGLPVDLRGTIELGAASVRFENGTNATALDIPAGGRLSFTGNFTHRPGSRVGGDGSVEFIGGRHDVLGEFAVRGDLLHSAGEVLIQRGFTNAARATLRGSALTLGGPTVLREVSLEGDSLTLAEELVIGRTLTWTAGRLLGGGSLRTEPTARVLVSGFNDKLLAATFLAAGEVLVTNNTRVFLNGGTWRIPSGATNEIQGGVQFWVSGGAAPGTLHNEGALRKTGAGTFDLQGIYAGAGAVRVEQGITDLGLATRFAGPWQVDAGAEVRLGAGTNTWTVGAAWAGSGTLRSDTASPLLRLEAPLDFGSLAVVVENGLRLQGEFPTTVGSAGSLGVRTGLLESEGALEVAGRMTVALGATVRIDDELRLLAGATLDNQGRRDGQSRSNVRVRAFPSLGGTLLGLAPDVVPPLSPLRWVADGAEGPSGAGARLLAEGAVAGVGTSRRLRWDPAESTRGVLEVSVDLREWEPVALDVVERMQGHWSLPTDLVPTGAAGNSPRTLFFRWRETEW